MSKTEKITVNIDVVDLGKIDLLVEQGFYSNRTDCIKTAIRNQLASHSTEVEKEITAKSYGIGIRIITKKELVDAKQLGKMLSIYHIGMLKLEENIDSTLATQTIQSIKVLGSFRATPILKEALKQMIEN
ncbi:CopG family transcriptional regulator [Virgibacillus soli]|uniref:CopG family transcriptional regulator n=1 Tax=Paracerasibacillus soli TaxID=480284 RepID=A0ABU5CTI3_9BACI|nr:CopG family transcriptional regulator [Virgibacillus soli]MDY0409565.1 CopG family transcriptional regulator [Virgibacillus soli]